MAGIVAAGPMAVREQWRTVFPCRIHFRTVIRCRLAPCLLAACLVLISGCPPQDSTRPVIQVGQTPSVPAAVTETVSPNPTNLPGNPFTWARPAGPVGVPEMQASIGRASAMVPVWDPTNQRMNLAGCGREVVGFQFQVLAPAGGMTGVKVTLTDLELVSPRGPGRIPRQSIELFRILPIRVVNLPGWYQLYETAAVNRSVGDFPDALVPADHSRLGQPWNLPRGEKLSLWADVPIPADTTPGIYEGRLSITSDNLLASGITVRLEVLPLNLPSDAAAALPLLCPLNLKQMLACELDRAELSDSKVLGTVKAIAAKRLAQWVDLGRRHGVQFVVADLAPVFKRDLSGAVQVDWSGYDEVVGPHLGGAGAPPFTLAPFRLDYPDPDEYGGVKAEPYKAVAVQYLKLIGQHWAARKWAKPLVWVHRDSPERATLPYGCPHWRDWLTDQRRQEAVTIGDLVWRAELGIGYLDVLPWAMRKQNAAQPVAPPSGLAVRERLVPPHVLVYAPGAEFLDPASLPNVQSEGLTVWLGDGGPPWRPSTEVFAHPEQLESLAYIAHRYGLSGVWLGPGQSWPAQSPLLAALPASEANFLFYSGRWFEQDCPVASLRLKFLRQAAQTAAYLKLMSDLHHRMPADAIAGAMVKSAMDEASSGVPGLGGPVGWQQEPILYVDARMMLRQELMRATGRMGTAAAAESRMRSLWLNFHARTSWVRLGAYPGQLVDQLDSFGTPSGVMRAVLRLLPYCDRAVCNPTVPGEGIVQVRWPTLNFGPLPGTWKATRYNVPVEADAAGAPLAVALAAEGRELPIDATTGRVPMPLSLKGDAGQELASLPTATPALPAHAFRRPPQIDGDLDDWPDRNNWFTGDGFYRLTMADPASMFAQPPPPPVRTWFMAGYDAHNLYLAVACLGQKNTEVTFQTTNSVDMDRGLIVGEDAVEVVLDPTGGRLDRQGLFHLAIKPTGMVLAWRGMTGPGGSGRPEAWGRNVRVAVKPRSTYWLIELAIPQAELGPTNAQGLWRINVVRHLAAQGEHSAWASSSPMTGEPESLGNLLLRRPPLPKNEIKLVPPSPMDD